MNIIDELKPKPLKPFEGIEKTEQQKQYDIVANALYKQGIYGEDNTMATSNILGMNGCCEDKKEKMNLDEICKEIGVQAAYAECITGYKPERIILGVDIFHKLITLHEVVGVLKNIEASIIIEGMYVTIDYRNKNIIKVVPEIKM